MSDGHHTEPWYAAYAERNLILKAMGYKCYKDYLDGALWREIRSRVLASDRRACQACGMQANCVHHYHYSKANLTGQNTEGLISLCHACHNRIEYAERQKLSLRQANALLDAKIANFRQRLANARNLAAERKSKKYFAGAIDKSAAVDTVRYRTVNQPFCPLCGVNPTCKHPKQGVPPKYADWPKKKKRKRWTGNKR